MGVIQTPDPSIWAIKTMYALDSAPTGTAYILLEV
jgi:hypothetical protein